MSKLRVLIVDDSRFDLEVSERALDGLGSLEFCENAESALECLADQPVDLVDDAASRLPIEITGIVVSVPSYRTWTL